MDVIAFGKEGKIYRATGEHAYVAGSGGVTSVCMVTDYLPHPFCKAFADSLCGKIHASRSAFKPDPSIAFEGSAFQGSSKEMYHVEGVLQLYHNNVQFKGVEGTAGLNAILDSVAPFYKWSNWLKKITVHNATFTFRLGVLVSAEENNYLSQR
jgi:hypothetical protein